VSGAYAFPWASFATPLLAKGLVAPNLLHLVSRTAAVAIPFAIVAAALFLAIEPRRSWLTATGLAVWTLVGFFCVATWFPDGDGTRWYVDKVYFEQLDVMGNPAPLIEPQLLQRLQRDRLMPPSSWPF
jgi:hypothetical protein